MFHKSWAQKTKEVRCALSGRTSGREWEGAEERSSTWGEKDSLRPRVRGWLIT